MKLLTFVSINGLNKLIENPKFVENNKNFFSKIEKVYLLYTIGFEQQINLEKFKKIFKSVEEPFQLHKRYSNDSNRIVEFIKQNITGIETEEFVFDNKHGTGEMREAAFSLYLSNPSSKLLDKKGEYDESGGWKEETIILDVKEEFYKLKKVELRRQIKSLGEKGYFHSALEILENDFNIKLFGTEKISIEFLRASLEGLKAWLLFDHSKASNKLYYAKKILEDNFPTTLYKNLEKNLEESANFLKKISQNASNQLENVESLVDRYNNIYFCKMQGRYDDAVARAYSLAEAIGKYYLYNKLNFEKYENFDQLKEAIPQESLNLLNEPLYKTLNFKLSNNFAINKKVFGLTDTFLVINLFDQDFARVFFDKLDGRFDIKKERIEGNLLEKRNKSILAHGKTPCDEITATKWENVCSLLLKKLEVDTSAYPSIKKLLDEKILDELKPNNFF